MKFFLFSVVVMVLMASFSLFAGEKKSSDTSQLIQFSGVVLSSDSLHAVPFAHIIIKNTGRGTSGSYDGFFSFVARLGDTVIFTSIGFKSKEFTIPPYLQGKKYSVIQLLTQDTINLPETLIYPWPTPEQFRQAFLSLKVPDDDLERAKKNLRNETLKAMGKNIPADGKENYNFSMNQYARSFYKQGQYPTFQIFNPMAWLAFMEAWKNGDFKKKE